VVAHYALLHHTTVLQIAFLIFSINQIYLVAVILTEIFSIKTFSYGSRKQCRYAIILSDL
jgi:hypothetical protein